MLLRQTIYYLPAQIFGPLAQVVAAIVWTHWLDPAAYGLLTFLIASQDLVFLVSLSWWTHYTMRYLGGLDGSARDGFLRSEASVYALTTGVQIVVTLMILAFLGEQISSNLALAAIACICTRSLLTHLGERARMSSRIGVYTLGQTAGSVLGFALAYALVVFVSASAEAVLYGFALAQSVGIVAMWWQLGVVRGQLLPRRDVLRAALAYGAPLLVAGGLTWVAQNGIRLVVEKLAGADALGLIAVGWGLGQRLSATLAMLVVAASFPLAVKTWRADDRGAAFRQLSNGGVMLVGLIVPASIGLCFLAEPFVMRFVAAPFQETTIAVLPYAAAAGAIRNIRMHIADPVFLLMERPRINTALNLFDAIAIVLGSLVGLWLGGLVGAVAGCLVATFSGTLLGFVLAYRVGEFSFPYADGLRIGIASAVMTVALALVPWAALAIPPLMRMALEVLLGGVVYALAVALLYPGIVRNVAKRLIPPRGTGEENHAKPGGGDALPL